MGWEVAGGWGESSRRSFSNLSWLVSSMMVFSFSHERLSCSLSEHAGVSAARARMARSLICGVYFIILSLLRELLAGGVCE